MHGHVLGLEIPQVVVIGRGMAGDEPSPATYARAVAATKFYGENPGVELIVFSSGYSSLANVGAEDRPSEARTMADIAGLPAQVRTELEETSTNTLENFLHSATFLSPDRTTGVLAHTAHLPRALFIARRVLGNPVVGIPAENFGADPESSQSIAIEKLQLAWVRRLLSGVEPRDLATLRERNELDKNVKRFAGSGLKKACALLGRRMPQQYQ